MTVCSLFVIAAFNFLRTAASLPRELAHMGLGNEASPD